MNQKAGRRRGLADRAGKQAKRKERGELSFHRGGKKRQPTRKDWIPAQGDYFMMGRKKQRQREGKRTPDRDRGTKERKTPVSRKGKPYKQGKKERWELKKKKKILKRPSEGRRRLPYLGRRTSLLSRGGTLNSRKGRRRSFSLYRGKKGKKISTSSRIHWPFHKGSRRKGGPACSHRREKKAIFLQGLLSIYET